ncbi:MAG: 3'-phosphoesterase [Candidatus Aminicenantes bacterium]|nr:3'-phosphoesterase [Candidatus Aminicenantes bacterium]
MGLAKYAAKRNFRKTPEPEGRKTPAPGPASDPIFVVQRHQASRLHWDLRLEEGGALTSWAVPKEPRNEEGLRRLAVQVEDHPLDYAEFEGTIPEGEYGAGTVSIWDRGTYRPIERTPAKRIVELRGGKLSGRYALIKLKPEMEEDRNWLFFKLKPKNRPESHVPKT